jgi:hypothetical protein
LVGWHAGTVSFPLSDVILAQLAFTLNDAIILHTSGIADLSLHKHWLHSIFVERKVCYSALFTNLVRRHAVAVGYPLSDIILSQLACPLYDVIILFTSGISNLSLHKHWLGKSK